MAARPLTVKGIEGLKAGAARREIPDGAQPGLYLVVQPSGSKSWALRYRHGDRTRKLTLDGFPRMGLAAARLHASKALAIAAQGRDPATERAAKRSEDESNDSYAEKVLERFLGRHKDKWRPSTAAENRRLIERHVMPKWRGRAIKSIGRDDVLVLLDEAADRGAVVVANRLLAVLRKFLNWCVERGIIETSPIGKVKAPTKEVSRDRVLTDIEIAALWQASADVGAPWGQIARLLLLTSQRREEVIGAKWSEFHLESAEPSWTIPRERAKNGVANFVPLSAAAVAVLKSVERVKDSDLVFTTTGETAVSGVSKGKARIDGRMLAHLREDDEDAELTPWRLHDLRRTATSGMAALRQPVHVVEAILNHKSGLISGVAATYNRYDYAAEKRAALNSWANKVAAITGQHPDNVVVMEKTTSVAG